MAVFTAHWAHSDRFSGEVGSLLSERKVNLMHRAVQRWFSVANRIDVLRKEHHPSAIMSTLCVSKFIIGGWFRFRK